MSALTRFLYPVPAERSFGHIIFWWEKRRLAFNLVVGATGLLSLSVIALIGLMPPHPGFSGPPPLAILIYGVIANLCYTLGWVIEGAAHGAWKEGLQPTGPVLFRQGLIFAVGVTLLPIGVALFSWAARIISFLW